MLSQHLAECPAAREQAAGQAEGQATSADHLLHAGYELAQQLYLAGACPSSKRILAEMSRPS